MIVIFENPYETTGIDLVLYAKAGTKVYRDNVIYDGNFHFDMYLDAVDKINENLCNGYIKEDIYTKRSCT